MLAESSDRDGVGYADAYGGGEEFLRKAGTVAQRRHTRKATLLDASSSTMSLPETPTSIPTSSDLDFSFPGSTKSSPNTSDGSNTADEHNSMTSQPFDASRKSFDVDNFTVPPNLPQAHIPLRKSSATNLRQKAYLQGDDEYCTTDAGSPIHSVFPERISSRTTSPRLRRDRQALKSSKENISPKDESHPVIRGRPRGLTSVSQRSPQPFDSSIRSPSIPDLRSSYKPNRGPGSRDASMVLRSPPPVPWKDSEEVRASFRSALTNGSTAGYTSSGYYDASETERSSVITRSSLASDFSKARVLSMEDDEFSVDDAIAMYANGFTDDAVVDEFDQEIEDVQQYAPRSPRPQLDAPNRTPRARNEQFDKERPMTLGTNTEYDSKFDNDFPLPRSPSMPQLPRSPLTSHLVNPALPSYPPLPPTPTGGFKFGPDSPPSPSSPLKPEEAFDFGPVSPLEPPRMEPESSPVKPSSLQTSPIEPPTVDMLPQQIPAKEQQYEPVPRDRYGFKKVTPYVTLEQYDAWNVGYTDYLERRKTKWEIMMMQWGLTIQNPIRFPPKSDKVKRYIRKGIPPEWRGACWFWYAGGPTRLAQNPGLYEILVEKAENGYLSDTDREIIERDLNRTFPDNIEYKPDPSPEFPGNAAGPDGPNGDLPIIKSLRRVLQAFAIHNPSIGYCQSLNFIAGMLLLFLQDEEKSFHMLNVITTTHLPGTHAKVLEANVDVGVLMTCIKDSMPAVWTKIDDINEGRGAISTSRLPTVSLATTAWFMSCFIGNLPTESVLRVWDSFFYEGSKTLFRIALAVFKSGESEIRNVNEHMEIFQVVQAIPRRLLDANALMESCYKRRNGFGHLSQDIIDSRRKERRTQLQKDRDRKNGQINPHLAGGDGDSVRGRGRASTLKRAASKARIMRMKSPALPEPMPGGQF